MTYRQSMVVVGLMGLTSLLRTAGNGRFVLSVVKKFGKSVRLKKLQKARRYALGKLPPNLNLMGFELALLLNYGITTSLDRLRYLFRVYEQVQK